MSRRINSGDIEVAGYIEINIIQIPSREEKDVLILIDEIQALPEIAARSEKPFPSSKLEIGITGQGEDRAATVTAFPCTVGRSRNSDIRLGGDYVSGKHCVIEKSSEQVIILRDLDSTNKTLLNGVELIPKEAYPLSKGDVIKIPGYVITVVSLQ
jgi:hypothetical protein